MPTLATHPMVIELFDQEFANRLEAGALTQEDFARFYNTFFLKNARDARSHALTAIQNQAPASDPIHPRLEKVIEDVKKDGLLEFCKLWLDEVYPLLTKNDAFFWHFAEEIVNFEKLYHGHGMWRNQFSFAIALFRKKIAASALLPTVDIEDLLITETRHQQKVLDMLGIEATSESKPTATSPKAISDDFVPVITLAHIKNLPAKLFAIYKRHVSPSKEIFADPDAVPNLFKFSLITTLYYETWAKQCENHIAKHPDLSDAIKAVLNKIPAALVHRVKESLKDAEITEYLWNQITLTPEQNTLLKRFREANLTPHVYLDLFDHIRDEAIDSDSFNANAIIDQLAPLNHVLNKVKAVEKAIQETNKTLPKLGNQGHLVRISSVLRAIRYLKIALLLNSSSLTTKFTEHLHAALEACAPQMPMVETPRVPAPKTPDILSQLAEAPASPITAQDLDALLKQYTEEYLKVIKKIDSMLGITACSTTTSAAPDAADVIYPELTLSLSLTHLQEELAVNLGPAPVSRRTATGDSSRAAP